MADPDIWWHLRNAESLIAHHELVRADRYSFTVPGHPWINSEWLAEVPYYLAWHAWGLMGIQIVLTAVIAAIFMALLYLTYQDSGNFKASVLACFYSIYLASVSFGPRTVLFGYAYILILLISLQRFRKTGRGPLWAIPPLFCLWANTHGSWLIGFVLFSIVVAAGLPTKDWGQVVATPWSASQLRKLVLTGAASAAAVFINPFGGRLVFYPFDLALRQKLNIAHIAEWVSVDFHELRGKLVLVLVVALFIAALSLVRRWTYAEVGLLLFALYSGLTYVRFLFLLGIVITPIIARMMNFIPPYRREIDKYALNALMMLMMIAGIAWFWPRTPALQASVDRNYPSKILPYLSAHPPDGPMLEFLSLGRLPGME